MSKESPTAYLSPSNLAVICPHKDMEDTWLNADSYVDSTGPNLQGKDVTTTTAKCDKCNSLVLVEVEGRYIR